jgi:predicted alpha/beta superfamily hydrolase
VKIGFKDSIQSEILQESRNILIHLPENYKDSDKSYPVLYRLDGNTQLMLETIATVNRLTLSDEIAPEMIIVAIENTNRPRDMWPVNAKYYPEPNVAGAKFFLEFIEKELIPYIETNYKTTQERIICGQSLSGVFTSYAFLTKPELFDSYIICSAAFPECEKYFNELSIKAFQQVDQFKGKKLFLTNGLKDPLDPNDKLQQQVADFSVSVHESLKNQIIHKYVTYENEGHVPYHSLYDGLKFIFEYTK